LRQFLLAHFYPRKLVGIVLSRTAIGSGEVTALGGSDLYLIIGAIGTGLKMQFYHHFEVRSDRPYRGGLAGNALVLVHLTLLNLGIAAASLFMIYAGFVGDLALSPVAMKGQFVPG
jgi:hypothetical protein